MGEPGILQTFVYETLIIQRKPESVPARFAEDWAQHTLSVIDTKTLPGWDALLVSEEHFINNMAQPAADGYVGFLAPGRISKKNVPSELSEQRHGTRIAASYTRLQAAIQTLLVDARADFEQRLLDTQEVYRVGEALPLSLTGSYFEQLLGAAVRQWFFLGSTAKFPLYRWASDVLRGDVPPPHPFAPHLDAQQLSKRLVRLLIQGGCFLLEKMSVDKVHTALDALLNQALGGEYAAPPQSSIRLSFVSGLPVIRTELKALVVPRNTLQAPRCPDINITIEATDIVEVGNPARNYYRIVLADIQHIATFDYGAEFESMDIFNSHGEPWDFGTEAINVRRDPPRPIDQWQGIPGDFQDHPEHFPILSSKGTSETAQTFVVFALVSLDTQPGLPYGVGSGSTIVRQRMVAYQRSNYTRYMRGRLVSYEGTTMTMVVLENTGSGSNDAWDIYMLTEPPNIAAFGLVDVGDSFTVEGRYYVGDNFETLGSGALRITVIGVE